MAVEVPVQEGRQVPEAGTRLQEDGRQAPEEGGRDSSSSDSSLTSSSNTGSSPTYRGVGGQSIKVVVEDLAH